MTISASTPYSANHLTDEKLHELAFSASALAASERDHLAGCTACQAQLAELQLLSRELQVAKWSQPSQAAKERYAALFDEAQVSAKPQSALSSWLNTFADTVRASVMWNGRDRLVAQGIRNASSASYRMLYSTGQAEIELLIEPVAGHFKVEGELLPMQTDGAILPVLLELYRSRGSAIDSTPIFSGESDDDGRFHIPPMPAGEYSLCLVPPEGMTMLIDALELV